MASLSSVVQSVYRIVSRPKPIREVIHAVLRAIIPQSIKIDGRDFFLDTSDPIVSGALTLHLYEREEMALFRSLIQPGMIVADMGAHIGIYSVIAALRGAKVIAFEPEPHNRELLRKNAEGLPITIIPKGVSDHEGSATLYLHGDNKGRHSIFGEGTPLHIETTTLSEKVDFIKMDIEGAEPLALKGACSIIETYHPTLMMEFTPHLWEKAGESPADTLAWLSSLGYRITEIGKGEITEFSTYARAFPDGTYANLFCYPRSEKL